MKTIIALILSCLSLSAATLYPVLSDQSTARTLTGGTTNVATLNGTNVFTGTNTFSGSVKGPTLTTLYESTNASVLQVSAAGGTTHTNNGDYGVLAGKYGIISMPALQASGSLLQYSFIIQLTNTTAETVNFVFYAGSNTNYLGVGSGKNSAVGLSASTLPLFANAGSWTNQYSALGSGALVLGATNFCDTSTNGWPLYVAIKGSAGVTNSNVIVASFKIVELR